MTEYFIRATNAAGWRRHKDGILMISVGKPYHEGDIFAATVKWTEQNFDRLHVVVCDTLQRHNDDSPDAAVKAKTSGDRWISTYRPLLERTGKLDTLIRWDDLIQRPEHAEILQRFRQAAQNSTELDRAIDRDVQKFLQRQKSPLPGAAQRSREYILEELAAFTLYARQQTGARLYPSKDLESFSLVAKQLVDTPRGLERQQRVALDIGTHKKKKNRKKRAPSAPTP